MNIAIIENNIDYVELLKISINGHQWSTEFFLDSEDFGKTNIKKYDVIIADYVLPNSINGRDLLKSIQSKTPAELFLMSAYPENFIEADIHNDNINGFIDKVNIQNIIDTLKYCDAKIRINRLMQSESSKFDYIVANGFSIEVQNNSIIVKITHTLSEASKQKIMEKVDSNKIEKAIISYPNTDILNSIDLGVIVSLFNSFKKRKIKMVFWNIEKNSDIKYQLGVCKLDMIFPIFDTLKECLSA